MAVRLGSATIKVCSIRILISVLYSFNSIESEIEPNLGMLFYNQRIFARTVQKKSSPKEDESVKISVPMRFLKNIYQIKEQRLGGVRIDMSFIRGKSMVVTLMKFGCLCEKVLMKLSVFRLLFVTIVF